MGIVPAAASLWRYELFTNGNLFNDRPRSNELREDGFTVEKILDEIDRNLVRIFVCVGIFGFRHAHVVVVMGRHDWDVLGTWFDSHNG